MTEPLLVVLGWKVASPLLASIAKYSTAKLLEESQVSRAIRATGDAFPGIENVAGSLNTWCTSNALALLLERLKNGERDLTDSSVVASFVGETGFFMDEHTESVAREIIVAFFEKVEEEFYGSGAGLTVHARREELLHNQTQETVKDVGQTVTAQIQQLAGLILQRMPPDDVASADVKDRVLHARVDEARALLDEGNPIAARSMLERLRPEARSQGCSATIEFRIATNLGAAALRLGNENVAKEEFRASLSFQPGNAKALANAACAELLEGDFDKAVELSEKALQLEPRNHHAASMYLQALHRSGRNDEVQEFLRQEEWFSQDAAGTLVIGSLHYDHKDYAEAERWLRVSLDRDPENPQTYALIAQSIIVPLQAGLREDPPLPWDLPESVRERAAEAERFLTRSVEILEQSDNRLRLRTGLVNRAAIRTLLGAFVEAIRDCDRVLAGEEHDNGALYNKSVALLQLDRMSEAADCLKRMDDSEERARTTMMLAAAYWGAGDYDTVVRTLEPEWRPELRARRQIEVGDLLASANMKVGETGKARAIVEHLLESWPADPGVLLAAARQRRNEGKLEDAVSLLREAAAYAVGHQREHLTLELADIRYAQGNYAEAAELYGPLASSKKGSPIAIRYIICLFNAGSYREALGVARAVRGDGPALVTISEVEALVLEQIGDLDAAYGLRRQLSEVEPRNVLHRVRMAQLDIRRGNRTGAEGILSSIRFEEIRNDAKTLMQVAEARALLGRDDVLRLAYRARQLEFGDPDIHLAYVGLFLRREDVDGALLARECVDVDSTVSLQRESESRVFTILGEAPVDAQRGELLVSDPAAVKLLGCRKGERVVIKDTPLEQVTYEVTEVRSKYVAAFQETMLSFTTWFPDNPSLHRVELGGDLGKVKMLLDARHERISRVMSLYQRGTITFGAFARWVGSAPSDVWAGMVSRPDGIMLASSGTVEERRRETEAVANTKDIVLDLTALLTWRYLDCLDRMAAGFETVLVPQAVLDEINETMARNYLGPRAGMTIWKEGDRYVRQEVTLESLRQGQEFLEGIREFIAAKAVLVPASGLLEFNKAKLQEMKDVLGLEAIAAVVVARERRAVMLSDDVGLRQLASNEWQVQGVWSQVVLAELVRRGVLRDDEYREAVMKLILANYSITSVGADDLMWVLAKGGMKPTGEFMRMMTLLEGPACSEESAIRVIADFVRRMWLERLLFTEKLVIVDLALGALRKGRMMTQAVPRLKAALRGRFALMPLALPVIFESIDLWTQQRRLEDGLPR